MEDPIRQTMQSGHIVIWEEIARDGAQAETLLSGAQRVKIARAMGAMFGEHGPNHLVFAAGYPSMGKEEYEAIRQVVAEVDNCSLATHGRVLRSDIDLGIQAMQGARYGRISYALPISDYHCDIMMHLTKEQALQQALEMARYALDHAGGMPVDVAFGVASRVEPSFLAEAAMALAEEGIEIVKVCDSTGELFPLEITHMFGGIYARIPPEKRNQVFVGSHLHNDFGLALANTLETIRLGTRLVASSWLGQGERAGLPPTEQLIFALATASEPPGVALPASTGETISQQTRLGFPGSLWLSQPDLHQIVPIAKMVSEMLEIPLRGTDAVVGTHMNHITTGAYFNNPKAFKPFDPHALLGVPPKLLLSHMSNQSIVEVMAGKLGFELTRDQVAAALAWVKETAYNQGKSVISEELFLNYLKQYER